MERMRWEDVVAKWSYYPDTSPMKLESTTQPLKVEQARNDRNLKPRPPEHGRKISTGPKLSLLLKLLCRTLCLKVGYETQEFGFGFYVPPLYTNFNFHTTSRSLKYSTLNSSK
jgi:hypothetical protein